MSDLVERLWSSDAASALTNEAARRITALENACRALCGSAGTVMRYLEEDGPKVVPHLVNSDDNPGQRTRDDIAATLKLIGY